MMMIAFITVRSSLVPLIEGLCAQIYFRFEISVVKVRASLGELGILERVGESVLYRRICQLLVNEVLFGGA